MLEQWFGNQEFTIFLLGEIDVKKMMGLIIGRFRPLFCTLDVGKFSPGMNTLLRLS